MARSDSDSNPDGGGRRAGRAGRGKPRWVTDRAQEVARQLPPTRRLPDRSHREPPRTRRERYPWQQDQDYGDHPDRDTDRYAGYHPIPGRDRDHNRGQERSQERSQDRGRRPGRDRAPADGGHRPADRRSRQPDRTPSAGARRPAAEDREWDTDQAGGAGRGAPPRQGNGEEDGPRKLTVTRVAAWRSRQLTQQGIRAFHRAATANGADRSGMTALTYPVMLSFAADAAVAVALANTLFFSAATAESRTNVALYLLITVAPFALLAPVIGPLLDRLQRGRRLAMAASFVGRGLLAVLLAQHFDSWLLYPLALGSMVLTRSFGVLKAAVTPRVLPPEITLTKVNSRMAVFGLAAGGVFGAVAAGLAALFGSPGSLLFATGLCAAAAGLCMRIPSWVEQTEGEVPAALSTVQLSRRRRQPMGRHIVVALWGNGTIRILTGFLTLFVAFVIKAETEQTGYSAWQQVVLLGMVGAAAGVGNVTGNALGARLHFVKPDQVILTCVGIVLGAAVLAAVVPGIGTAAVVGLVGSTCSSLAKVCHDAVVQRDMPEESRASAFGRTETILQLAWTFGGALGVLLPPIYWLGFAVVAVLVGLGTIQTTLAHRGSSLIPRLGGDRPIRPDSQGQRRSGATRPEPAWPQDEPDGDPDDQPTQQAGPRRRYR